jgi:hypothetical protein
MLAGLIEGKFRIFRQVPFSKFSVEFTDGSILQVHTEDSDEQGQLDLLPGRGKRRVVLTGSFPGPEGNTRERWEPHKLTDRDRMLRRHVVMDRIAHDIPVLTRVAQRTWRHDVTRVLFDLDDVLEQFGEHLHLPLEATQEPPPMHARRRAVHVHVIQTQRLETQGEQRSRHDESPALTVERYSQHLAHETGNVLQQYAAVSQRLDRNFPWRLFQEDAISAPPVADLRSKLDELEVRRAQLRDLGFLELEENPPRPPDTIIAKKSDVFSIYVKDVETKLAVFNEMARRVELLRSILAERFSYKRMKISREHGFQFTSDSGDTLGPSDLSSGEQHEIVMLYDLIFNLKENSLVLIDEPEISLHIVWQQNFLRDLRKIIELVGFDAIIATHSPQIIGRSWELTEELKGPPTETA